jgi:uncharacterized membrane protein YdbT with pleckstrin-like domain
MEFDWLSLDEDEEVLWSGKPRIQKFLGLSITDYVVTSQGLYRKTGMFSRNVQKIGFEKVQNISFTQGILGTQFGYGSIGISTAGGSGVEMRFAAIDDPKKVQEMINSRIKEEKSGSGKGKSQFEVMEEILQEVKEINEKL